MRFATVFAVAVAADGAVEWLDSASTTVDFSSDNADEKASVSWVSTMNGDAITAKGTTTITSKSRNLDNWRWSLGMRAASTDTNCFLKATVYTNGNVAADETYKTDARASQANQLNCGDANQLLQAVQKGNINDGFFNPKDPTYMTTSAKRTQKQTGTTPAIAVTEWSRPVAESPEKAWPELPNDSEFEIALSWRAVDQQKFSKQSANNNIKWWSGKLLPLQKKSAVALQMGAAVLAVASATLY